jgi:hypothetical protein
MHLACNAPLAPRLAMALGGRGYGKAHPALREVDLLEQDPRGTSAADGSQIIPR